MGRTEQIEIICSDGFKLAGTIYQAKRPKAAVMIGPATGIKRGFYHKFASFLAENNFSVLTYDNRGIGGSQRNNINKIDASLITWGRLDMTAALEELKSRFPGLNYHLVGHSAGGQLLGLMDNALELTSLFNFAASSGSVKNMSYPFKLNALFFLNIFIPFSNFFFKKTNSNWIGMGEPLPYKVAAQWRKWCNNRGYVKTALGKEVKEHFYNDLSLPSLWLHATDDGIANYDNVIDMLAVFPKINAEVITLNPRENGMKEIGHMKFFSSKNDKLWSYALDWLNKN